MNRQLQNLLSPSFIGIEGQELSGKTLFSFSIPKTDSVLYIDLFNTEHFALKYQNPAYSYAYVEEEVKVIDLISNTNFQYYIIDSVTFFTQDKIELNNLLEKLRSIVETQKKSIILIFNNLAENNRKIFNKYSIAYFDYFFYIKHVKPYIQYGFKTVLRYDFVEVLTVYSSSDIPLKHYYELDANQPKLYESRFLLETFLRNGQIIKKHNSYIYHNEEFSNRHSILQYLINYFY